MQRIPPVLLGNRLRLVSVTVPFVHDDAGAFRMVISVLETVDCPYCGAAHSVRERRTTQVRDLPYGDHPVLITLTRGTAYCPVFAQTLPCDLPDREGTVTASLKRYLRRRYGMEARVLLAARTGLSESTIRKIQRAEDPKSSTTEQTQLQLVQPLPSPKPMLAVNKLGVDDIYMLKSRFLVATDLETRKILKLSRIGTVTEGRASAVDLDDFFAGLPDTDMVALDMNPQQYEAAARRWPTAIRVIDKRHLLQTIDRDLTDLAARVVLGRWDEFGDQVAGKQAVLTFGLAAYPYLALRTLVLRRRRSLSPADHAAWVLLRREGQVRSSTDSRAGALDLGQMLYEAWLWREDLYDLYDAAFLPRRSQGEVQMGLERWQVRVLAWQTAWLGRWEDSTIMDAPLRRILWVFRMYLKAILSFPSSGGLTNAQTELTNASLRRYLRQGRRYDPEALVTLINREVPVRRRGAAETLTPPSVAWVRADAPVPDLPTTRRAKPAAAAVPKVAVEEPAPLETVTASNPLPIPAKRRLPRNLPRQHPDLAIPSLAWCWLHTLVPGGRTQGERWSRRIVELAPTGFRSSWRVLCAGDMLDAAGEPIPADHLAHWQAAVLQQYIMCVPGYLSGAYDVLAKSHLELIFQDDPTLHARSRALIRRLVSHPDLQPTPEDVQILADLGIWQELLRENE